MHSYSEAYQPRLTCFRSLPWCAAMGLALAVALTTACSHTSDTVASASENQAPASAAATAGGTGAATVQSAAAVDFDAARAYRLLQAQCDFGPRPMGSPAHTKCRDFLVQQMQPLVDEFTTQNWNQPVTKGPGAGHTYAMTNLLGMIRGQNAPAGQTPQLLLCAHWDTRPVADMDPDPVNRSKPILGANDGASGVAVLLEVARVLKSSRPAQTVAVALWDGEDLGEFFYGARHFAELSRTAQWKKWRPDNAILLDMIGDRDLQVDRETNSMRLAPDLYQQVMNSAADLGLAQYFNGPQRDVLDDHIPLNEAGIPAVDLIDFSYRPWHTLDDTPDKCSPASLKVIGTVLLRLCAKWGQA